MVLNRPFGIDFVIGADSDEFRVCSLNLRIILLQLTELRSAERSPATAVKYKNNIFVSDIVSKRVCFAVAIC